MKNLEINNIEDLGTYIKENYNIKDFSELSLIILNLIDFSYTKIYENDMKNRNSKKIDNYFNIWYEIVVSYRKSYNEDLKIITDNLLEKYNIDYKKLKDITQNLILKGLYLTLYKPDMVAEKFIDNSKTDNEREMILQCNNNESKVA